jgi:cytoskeletal protein CcmA (bactofilin family)
MFTKKPEREGDPLSRMSERTPPSESTTPFAERPVSYARSAAPSKLVPSIIGEDLSVTGNIVSKGEIQIDGEVQGDVHCGSLLLGEKSQIIGGVVAEDVVVRGRVVGSIRGLRVTLQAQSHVEGDVYHQSLAIEQGAYFEGKSRRSDDPLSTSKTAPAAKSEGAAERRSDRPTFEQRVEKAADGAQSRAAE